MWVTGAPPALKEPRTYWRYSPFAQVQGIAFANVARITNGASSRLPLRVAEIVEGGGIEVKVALVRAQWFVDGVGPPPPTGPSACVRVSVSPSRLTTVERVRAAVGAPRARRETSNRACCGLGCT